MIVKSSPFNNLSSKLCIAILITVCTSFSVIGQQDSLKRYLSISPQINILNLPETDFSNRATNYLVPNFNLSFGTQSWLKSIWLAVGLEFGLNTYNLRIDDYRRNNLPSTANWNGTKTFTYTNFGGELRIAYKILQPWYVGARASLGFCNQISEGTNSESAGDQHAFYLNEFGHMEYYYSLGPTLHGKIGDIEVGAYFGYQMQSIFSGHVYGNFTGFVARFEYRISF